MWKTQQWPQDWKSSIFIPIPKKDTAKECSNYRRGTRDQIANIHWTIKKAREFLKNICFCFVDYAKAFVWITGNCGKFLKRWNTRPLDLLVVKWSA